MPWSIYFLFVIFYVLQVWGCGGVEAAESQKRLREWEMKEAIRRREACLYTLLDLQHVFSPCLCTLFLQYTTVSTCACIVLPIC